MFVGADDGTDRTMTATRAAFFLWIIAARHHPAHKLKCICFLPQKSFTFVTMIPITVHTLMIAACTSEHSTRINSFARLCTQVTRMKNSGSQHLAHSPRRSISCAWIFGSLDDAGWGARVRGNRGMLLVDASPRHLAHAPSGVL